MLKVIASSSKGNLYLLSSMGETLMIECGLPWKMILEAIDFNTSRICGCLVTHRHMDHAGSIKKIIEASIDTFSSKETFESAGIGETYLSNVVTHGKMFRTGPFRVIPFSTVHDCDGSYGYLITDGEKKLLFATDTKRIDQDFPGLTHIAVECNYDIKILDDNLKSGRIHQYVYKRVRETHMSLERCIDFLERTDLSKVEKIYLIHGSVNNLYKPGAKAAVEAATGIEVKI